MRLARLLNPRRADLSDDQRVRDNSRAYRRVIGIKISRRSDARLGISATWPRCPGVSSAGVTRLTALRSHNAHCRANAWRP